MYPNEAVCCFSLTEQADTWCYNTAEREDFQHVSSYQQERSSGRSHWCRWQPQYVCINIMACQHNVHNFSTAYFILIDRGMGVVSLHSYQHGGHRIRISNCVLEGKVCLTNQWFCPILLCLSKLCNFHSHSTPIWSGIRMHAMLTLINGQYIIYI